MPKFQLHRKSFFPAFVLTLLVMTVGLTTQTYCVSRTQASAILPCRVYRETHQYSEWMTIQTLTCTRAQVEVCNCECGYGVIRRTAETGHQIASPEMVQTPTCTEPGYTQRTCTLCGQAWRTELDATGHTWGKWETIQTKTCTQDGVITRVCSACNITEEKTDKATGHQYGKSVQIQAPTCTKTGTTQKTCKLCQSSETQKIDKVSHQYRSGQCTVCHAEDPTHYPKIYKDDGVQITIHKIEGYGAGHTTCYIADVQLTDYTRFFTACGNNRYGGRSGTQAAAKLQNAVLAINGCYSAPDLNYTVVRRGIIHNGANRNLCVPAVYSSKTGLLSHAYEGANNNLAGSNVQELVDAGLLTDTFCFGAPVLVDGHIRSKQDNDRAQRTFIGTDGKPGHLLLCVSNGRYSDGKSAGLTYYETATLMKEYGCTFGVPLDGGGSSTMVFKGQVLNQLTKGQERTWITDFCCVGY